MRSAFAACTVLALLATGCLSGCATTGPTVAKAPSPQTAAAFDQLKTLQGNWVNMQDGKETPGSTISVSSAGSAVREVMFPGSPHEMTNMFHLDGDAIVATHYCAMGNQPTMRCTHPANGVFAFRFAGISNLQADHGAYMAELTLTIVDANHIRQEWWSMDKGQRTGPTVFDLVRK